MTFPEIASALQQYIGKNVDFEPVSVEDWMAGTAPYIGDPEKTMLPRGAKVDNPTAFTFRKTFGAWLKIWSHNRKEVDTDASWANEYYPDRPKTMENWMSAVRCDPSGPFPDLS